MSIFMETTRIAAERTLSEIQTLLSQYGARSILLDYEGCRVSSVSFKIAVEGKAIPFMLPCRWKALETLLRESGRRPKSDDTYEGWARRVAWRQILRWVQAQFALIETNMVKVQEVFLPYAQGRTGETLYERLEKSDFLMLEGPKEKP